MISHGQRFRKLAEERLARRYRVLAPDLRGHGRSSWEPPWCLTTHLDDIRATLGIAGVARGAFVGHSFGGRLVLELAAAAPSLVERAVLLDPAIWVPGPIALEYAEAARADVSYASVEEAIAARIEASGLVQTPRELLDEEMRQHLRRTDDGRYRYRYSHSAVVAAFGEMANAPPELEQLEIPTLLVRGAQTNVVPPIVVELVVHAMGRRVEVVDVPGGHNVLWDAFDATADAIESFLHRPR